MKRRRTNKHQISFDFAAKKVAAKTNMLCAKSRRVRMASLYIGAVLWCGVIGTRLFSLQISDFERWQDTALKQHFTEIDLASERGPLLDRENKLLAVSVPAGSVYVRPGQVKDKEAVIGKLSQILSLDKKVIRAKLEEKSPFVWVARQIPRHLADKVAALDIKGVNYLMESRRFYPYNEAASTLIGKVGIDGSGLSGVEKLYEKELHQGSVKTKVNRDAFGNSIQISTSDEKFELPKGSAVKLTIDTAIQQIMDEELVIGRDTAKSNAVMAVMVDADTGEILGMGQSPSPNLNNPSNISKDDLKNLVVESVFEPGSIFKPLVAAAALEEKVVRPSDIINCENGHYMFAKHDIKDVHPSGLISVHDVVVRSSNIGMTKIGLKLGKDKLYGYLKKFGFGERSRLGLPGETEGILRNVSTWAMVDVATHSFGQGVAVTPLQMVRAVSAIANGGKLPTLRLVDDGRGFELKHIISEETAAKVREMMYGVVEDEHGTGKKAEINGVRVGGKTGTAQKAREDGRGYKAGAYVSSFVGFADGSPIGLKKNLSLVVMVDEPKSGAIYGGVLAAPIFKRIMQRTLHLLATRSELAPFEDGPVPEEGKGDIVPVPRGPKTGFTSVSYRG